MALGLLSHPQVGQRCRPAGRPASRLRASPVASATFSESADLASADFGAHCFKGAVAGKYLSKYGESEALLATPGWTATKSDVVASALLDWAKDNGASVYCHWFQPSASWDARTGARVLIATTERRPAHPVRRSGRVRLPQRPRGRAVQHHDRVRRRGCRAVEGAASSVRAAAAAFASSRWPPGARAGAGRRARRVHLPFVLALSRPVRAKRPAFPPRCLKRPFAQFTGKDLLNGQTDGSSFPNGGLRATHCAGAFLTVDPESPPFLIGDTIFIPAVVAAYTGFALDEKTPLHRANQALSKEGARLLGHLGLSTSGLVNNIGLEQELFLVPREQFFRRPDLQARPRAHTALSHRLVSLTKPRARSSAAAR